MKLVRLYGELGKQFGRVHKFDVRTGSEAIRALIANFPSFEKYMKEAHLKNVGFKVVNGRDSLDQSDQLKEPISRSFKIVPVILGSSGETRALIGIAIIAVTAVLDVTTFGGFSSSTLGYGYQVGIAMTLGGVIEMLSPKPNLPDPQERPDSTPSTVFSGAVNTTAQGQPVPVCYGRMVVGSAVISGGITVEQLQAGS